MASAVQRAGSAPPAALTKALRRGVFDTVLGRVAFDGKGDLQAADRQWQIWIDGRQELLPVTRAAIDRDDSTGGACQLQAEQ